MRLVVSAKQRVNDGAISLSSCGAFPTVSDFLGLLTLDRIISGGDDGYCNRTDTAVRPGGICRLIAEGRRVIDPQLLKRVRERRGPSDPRGVRAAWARERRRRFDPRRAPRGMRYVLDSNVALKWVLRESDSDKACRLRDDWQQGILELLAPDVFPIEVAHALARSERRGIMTAAQGPIFLAGVLATQPTLHAYIPRLWRAYAIASRARMGVYDCLYVALAEQEACELVTADDRLIRALQPTCPFIKLLAALP